MRNHKVKSQPSWRGEVASTAANAAANRGHRTAGGCLEISLRNIAQSSTSKVMIWSTVTRQMAMFKKLCDINVWADICLCRLVMHDGYAAYAR
jgi:hypothetical protein